VRVALRQGVCTCGRARPRGFLTQSGVGHAPALCTCSDNPDGKIVLDIVLTDQDAVIDLPGMIVRLRSGADSDADGSGDDGVEDDGLGDGLDMDDLVRGC
jgi:hypothetical protein